MVYKCHRKVCSYLKSRGSLPNLKGCLSYTVSPSHSGVEEAVLHWSGKSVKLPQLLTFNH